MNDLQNIMEFIGRFHPVLVHLPIGILLLGAIFLALSGRERYSALNSALPLTFMLGALAAVASCVTGWLLAKGGEYDPQILDRHRWLGIAVAGVATAGYTLLRGRSRSDGRLLPAAMLVGLLTVTGHLGGTLTHGSGYLTQPVTGGDTIAVGPLTVAGDVQEALVYADLVGPLLERKCTGCHGAAKRKGGLRLDTPEGIGKGGKNGAVLVAGQADHSELCRRLALDLLHEDHMPPKGKPQLTEAERSLLNWWIDTGAGFADRVKERPQTEAISRILRGFEAGAEPVKNPPEVPGEPVPPAADTDLNALRAAGVLVIPVGQSSNYLSVNYVNAPRSGDADLALLLPLARQLVWLKLGDTPISDAGMTTVGQLLRLTRLGLERTAVTDAGLPALLPLADLRYLNLSETAVTAAGVLGLRKLPRLQTVYLYETGVAPADTTALRQAMPKVQFEIGAYALPLLESDTALVRIGKK